MASPIKPSDVQALIIQPSDTFCVALKKFLHAIFLFYKWVKYCNAEDGLIADAHGHDLCTAIADCPDQTPTV